MWVLTNLCLFSDSRSSTSPSRKASLVSLLSEVSLPPWNLSGRNTPNYNSLSKAEGNLRSSKRNKTSLLSGTKSLGRATGLQYLRQGDAGLDPNYNENWNPESDAKATTLSRNASGRGSIRKPALTKAALLRLSAGEKKADEEEKKRLTNEFGNNNINNNSNNFDYLRNKCVTPNSNLMTRSAYDYSRNDRCKSQTPQMSRRSSSRSAVGRESTSPYSWQSFKPVIKPSAYHPLTSTRAEPDGIEDEEDQKRKDSLEGEYDHSKEYDPFQVHDKLVKNTIITHVFLTDSRATDAGVVVWNILGKFLLHPRPKAPTCETICHLRLLCLYPWQDGTPEHCQSLQTVQLQWAEHSWHEDKLPETRCSRLCNQSNQIWIESRLHAYKSESWSRIFPPSQQLQCHVIK